MNNYCVDLNLPLPLSDSISDIVGFLKQYDKGHFQIDKELVNNELKLLLDKCNLDISLI